MKKQFSLLALFLFVLTAIQAQSGALKGRIVDENELSVPGAYIYSDDEQFYAVSDVNGNYAITGMPAGDYNFKVSYIGFIPVENKINITDSKTSVLNFELKAGIVGLQEVVVSSSLQGQSKALNQQKTSSNITNVIAADQVGKFPDANIGDALKRIPGINVQYDQGEARFGNIRGTAPQYNSVTINGERIPSAEAEMRSIQLDLIPSDQVQSIEVNKAVTPDMDADAIGASVNLVTLSEPASRRISGSFGAGYNQISEKPNYTANLSYSDRFANDNIGMVLGFSINNNKLGSDNVEGEWDLDDNDDIYLKELQIRQYYLQRLRQSYSGSFDFKLSDNHTIYLKGMYNRRKDWENRFRLVTEVDELDNGNIFTADKIEREVKSGGNDKNARLEDQQMKQFSLSGDHIFGKVKADWGFSYSKASEDRPQERYLNLKLEEDGQYIVNDFSDSKKPLMYLQDQSNQDLNSNWEFDELTEENQYTEDIDIVGRLNFEIPMAQGAFKNSLKIGGKYKTKSKKRDNDFYEYSPIDEGSFMSQALADTKEMSRDNFMPGDKYNVGTYVTKEFVGELDLNNSSVFEKEADYSEFAGNFDASETVTAGYIMFNQNLGKKLSAILGVRVENTKTEGEGYNFDDSVDGPESLVPTGTIETDYTNVLPNLHVKYDLNKNTIARFAYTSTIARPGYFDLIPYQQIEDEEEISIGNPDLKATTSNNIDVMFEHYFKTIGIISGGFFYKNIKDFIVDETHDDYVYNGFEYKDFKHPINGGDATLLGLEFSAQRQLDFLPGFLSRFGIYANYTYTKSEITDFNIEDREDETLDMPGSPEHTLNASLSYETKKFTGRLSYNYASDFIDEFGDEAALDRYYDQVTYLDLNLTYALKKNYIIYVDCNNLLNQPLRYFQGESNRTMQMEYYGMTAKAGIKINF